MKKALAFWNAFLFLLPFSLLAQPEPRLSGSEYYKYKDYGNALIEFLKDHKKEGDSESLNIKVADCYMNLNDDRTKAVPFLEAVLKNEKCDPEALFLMGRAQMSALRFDKALEFFYKYREKVSDKNKHKADRWIDYCENAKELMKRPANVSFENLGKEVNTPFPDYYPFVTEDEGTLFFTSRRETNIGNLKGLQGYMTADIYTSKVKSGVWGKAKNIGTIINTAEDEECVFASADGKRMIVYIEDMMNFGDIYYSDAPKGKTFSKPAEFAEPVNTNSLETEACISDDGQHLYFASDRSGGSGETDIYFVHRLPNGQWGIPQNLGPVINTPHKEAFPVFIDKTSTLYFASEGHTSMGGFDIFKSKYDSLTNKWSTPVNLGYPINTPEDNMQISFPGHGRHAYMSAYRKGGVGDLDIYKVTFMDRDEELTVLRGKVTLPDSTAREIDATVGITDVKTGEEIDVKNVNPKTGRYIFALEPGKYQLVVTSAGCKSEKIDITVLDKSEYKPEIERNIRLEKPGAPAPKPASVKPPVKK